MRGRPEAVPGRRRSGRGGRRRRSRRGGGQRRRSILGFARLLSASMAGERGAEATGPAPAPGGSSSPNARPSAGASLTPATTTPNSSIVLTPGAASDASAASLAFRSAPILLRRARTEAGAACRCAGATSAPNCVDASETEAPTLPLRHQPRCFPPANVWRPWRSPSFP